jgi:RNA polymerase sigma-70 factor (ECF subfamily)
MPAFDWRMTAFEHPRRGLWSFAPVRVVTVQDMERLMARVRERDKAAFEAVYEKCKNLVYGIAIRMLAEPHAAEDVVQSVFLTVWTRPDSFRAGNLAAWLARVTRNRCLDVLRSRADRSADVLPAELPEPADLDDTVFARIDGAHVRDALARLPEAERTPIEMGFFDGVTHAEIAARTGVPLGTIKTRIRTGLRRLREQLERIGVK